MIPYSLRTQEATLLLLESSSVNVHKVYSVIELSRNVDSFISNAMTIPTLVEEAKVSRRDIYRVLDELEALGLIEVMKLKRRGLYQFRLLKAKAKAEVVNHPTMDREVVNAREEALVALLD